jgi:ring-1,2-phenylacetyl-CoA epoxidase subunit PaaE
MQPEQAHRFHPLTIREIRRETADAVSISFAVPDHLAETFHFKPGQYLTLKADIAGADIRRTYSICTAPLDRDLRIAIKHLPGGRFSTYANHTLRQGDVLDVLPAAGHFTTSLTPTLGHARRYIAFAAGSGITPILAHIRAALQTQPETTIMLFYANRHSTSILFLEDLAGLKNRFMNRLQLFHVLSAEEDEIPLFNGRLDREKCDHLLRTIVAPTPDDLFLLCGPAGMMHAAEAALLAAGIPRPNILLERFATTASPTQTAQARAAAQAAAGRTIGVVLDGRKSTITFNPTLGNILDNVRAAGLPAPYACKGGVCATCRAKLLSGHAEMKLNYGLTTEEVAQGYILTCQSTPQTDNVVVSYDL